MFMVYSPFGSVLILEVDVIQIQLYSYTFPCVGSMIIGILCAGYTTFRSLMHELDSGDLQHALFFFLKLIAENGVILVVRVYTEEEFNRT